MEPQISPLARRLAEENSIDWRVIQGTGPDSRVIERDILTYLARIMSGEIDPPALPDASEPPPSSVSVPDLASVNNLAAASAGMAKEGIDLGSLLGQAPAAPMPAPAPSLPPAPEPAFVAPSAPIASTPIAEPEPEFSLEELRLSEPSAPPAPSFDFAAPTTPEPQTYNFASSPALELEAPEPAAPAVAAPVATPATSAEVEFDFDLDDLEEAPQAAAPETVHEDIVHEDMVHEDMVLTVDSNVEQSVTFVPEPAVARPNEDFAFADPSGEPVLEIEEAPLTASTFEPAPAAFVEPVESAPSFATFAEPTHEEPAAFTLPEPTQPEPAQPVALETVHEEAVHAEPVHAETAHADPAPVVPEAPVAPAFELDDEFEMDLVDPEPAPVAYTQPSSFETPSFEAVAPAPIPAVDLEPEAIEPVFAAPPAPESAPEPAPAFEATPTSAPLEPSFVAPAAALGVAALAATHESPVTHEEAPVASSHAASNSAASSPASPSAVAQGFYQGFAVRRHFDAAPLRQIQRELSTSLNNREVPLGVFLGRAAQRNLHSLGTTDTVTLARIADTLEPLSTPSLHHSFLEALQSVARATPAGSAYGLVVVDSSHLGVDDLVLPGAQPVLTLNVNGEYGHLSLAGDLPASKAAEFLVRVAAALEVPVSLVI